MSSLVTGMPAPLTDMSVSIFTYFASRFRNHCGASWMSTPICAAQPTLLRSTFSGTLPPSTVPASSFTPEKRV